MSLRAMILATLTCEAMKYHIDATKDQIIITLDSGTITISSDEKVTINARETKTVDESLQTKVTSTSRNRNAFVRLATQRVRKVLS